jgi:hypothetical protein
MPSNHKVHFCFLKMPYAVFCTMKANKKGGVNSQKKGNQISDEVGGIMN